MDNELAKIISDFLDGVIPESEVDILALKIQEAGYRKENETIEDLVKGFSNDETSTELGQAIGRFIKCFSEAAAKAFNKPAADKGYKSPKILYLCNKSRCNGICDYPDCKYTSDIIYAKNFKITEGGEYLEEEQKEYENKRLRKRSKK